jgi:hypothetical protein
VDEWAHWKGRKQHVAQDPLAESRFCGLLPKAAVGGIYAGTKTAAANYRNSDDWMNNATAGCAAGTVIGLKGKNHIL